MPQLDITTFLSQIIFTLIIFVFFYSNLIQWVIPFLSQSLKIRKKKTKYLNLNLNNIQIFTTLIAFFKNILLFNKFNNIFLNISDIKSIKTNTVLNTNTIKQYFKNIV